MDLPIVCPAGQPIGETPQGPGCRCTLERNSLTVYGDPRSLMSFCMNEYTSCPTWTTEKRRVWAARKAAIADVAMDATAGMFG